LIDYSGHLLKADKHMRMAYHFCELKDYKQSMEELIGALVEIKLVLTIVKDINEQVKKS